jgi:hypothetical protein
MAPAAMSVASQQHSSGTLTLTSLNSFSDTLALGCLGLPDRATCTFTSNRVALASGGVQVVTVVVDTGSALTGGAQARNEGMGGSGGAMLAFLPGGLLLGLLLWPRGLRRRLRGMRMGGLMMLLALAAVATGLTGCAGLQINGTPAGTYTFQVTALGTGTGVTQAMNVTLTVTP